MQLRKLERKADEAHDAGKYKEADHLYRLVRQKDPNHPGVIWNEAKCLHDQNRAREAGERYCEVILCKGDYSRYKTTAMNNAGILLMQIGEMKRAQKCFEYVIGLAPNYAPAWNNLGITHLDVGDYAKAEECWNMAVSHRSELADARMNCGTIRLTLGDFSGWKDYEYRWKTPNFATTPTRTEKPQWKGEPLEGKTILLTAEQGCGDAIQFVRYAPLVADQFNPEKVIYHGHRETEELFQGVDGIDEYSHIHDPSDIPHDSYDYHCPLLSLPTIFGTTVDTVPADVPYIDVPRGEVEITGRPLSVGVVWQGNPHHRKDKDRSTDGKHFGDLASEFTDINWLSLQVPPQETPKGITDLSAKLNCYTDTASVIRALDLVIAVDTSVAHLAGAVGANVWTLLPYCPDWRWMLEREDSPWYPTMRLFRQTSKGDWDGVFDRVKAELKHFERQRIAQITHEAELS